MLLNVESNFVDVKALGYKFYTQMRVEKKAFAYRVPIGDFNYLQSILEKNSFQIWWDFLI